MISIIKLKNIQKNKVRDWARVETSYSHVLSSLTFIAGWLENLTSRWLADFLVRPSVPLGDAKTDFQPLSITQVTQKIKPFFLFFSFLQTENWFFFLQRSNCPLHGDSVFLLKFKLPLQYSHFLWKHFIAFLSKKNIRNFTSVVQKKKLELYKSEST
jgi:hypothetical protein